MTYAARAHRWNERYDSLPDRWRFQVVLWPLLLIGTINMMLTIASGFPFALLLMLALLALAFVRIPYKAGWLGLRGAEQPEPQVHLGRVDWAWNLNQKYDAMPEWRRFWVFPAVLIVAGGINMALTLSSGFPFALLFLLALLAIVAIRAPYVWGWLTPPGADAAKPNLMVRHDTQPAMQAYTPAAIVAPQVTEPVVMPPAAATMSAASSAAPSTIEHDLTADPPTHPAAASTPRPHQP